MPTKIEKDAITGTDTTGHEWDGLKELNTPLPTWWLYTFYACCVFALVWVVLYPAIPVQGWTGITGWTARGAITGEMETARARTEPMLARLRSATPEQIAANPELRAYAIAGGRAVFANNCAACHSSKTWSRISSYVTRSIVIRTCIIISSVIVDALYQITDVYAGANTRFI
jgi:cytochrome c oxidase cbb3-type subunit 3